MSRFSPRALWLVVVIAGSLAAGSHAAEKRVLKAPQSATPKEVLVEQLREAFALLDAGATEAARRLLEQVLMRAPRNVQALGGLGVVRLREGNHAQARQLLEQAVSLAGAEAAPWRAALETARFWEYLGQARALRDGGDWMRSEALVRQALTVEPGNAEALALLASLRELQSDDGQAQELYRQALSRDGLNESAVRGLGNLWLRLHQWDQVTSLLETQPQDTRVSGGKYSALQVASFRGKAVDWVAQRQTAYAVKALQDALALEPGNVWVRYDLANVLLSVERPAALVTMQEGLAFAPKDAAMAYASALVYEKVGDHEHALALLEGVPPAERTEPMALLLREMRVRTLASKAQEACRSGAGERAGGWLAEGASVAADETNLLDLLASAHIACHQERQALALIRGVMERQTSPSMALRLVYLSILASTRQLDLLRPELEAMDPMQLNAEQREVWRQLGAELAYQSAYAALEAGRVGQAETIVDRLVGSGAKGTRLALLQGRVYESQGRLGQAWYALNRKNGEDTSEGRETGQEPALETAMASLLQRRSGEVRAGVYSLRKPGTPGQSDVRLDSVPLEITYPLDWEGQVLVRATPVRMQAGTLELNDNYALMRFGKVQALVPSGAVQVNPMEASGTALTVGYQSAHWIVEGGTTPAGFPVQDGVGRVVWNGPCQQLTCSVEVSKTAVTDSLLSYAGAQDPASGDVWGGVRATAVDGRLRVAQDADAWDLHLGYRMLTGREVLNNTQWDFGVGVERAFFQTPHSRWTVGVAYTFWGYEHDLNHYTFGHGGYYSPQTYHALSLPWRTEGQIGAFTFRAEGTVFTYWGSTKDMPFYPTSASLQTAAGNPVHLGEQFNGNGYSVALTLERRLRPGWIMGGRVEVGRSPYYTPNTMAVYLRYQWVPDRETVARWPVNAPGH